MFFFIRILIACVLGASIGTFTRYITHRGEKPVAAASAKPIEQKTESKGGFFDFPSSPRSIEKPGKDPQIPRVSGYVVLGKRVNVVLSDGRTLTELDPELKIIHRNSVTVGNDKLYFVQAKDKTQPPAPPAPAPVVQENTPQADTRPPPPGPSPSAWVMHSDGVARLLEHPVIGK